jgi:hypothetical protein
MFSISIRVEPEVQQAVPMDTLKPMLEELGKFVPELISLAALNKYSSKYGYEKALDTYYNRLGFTFNYEEYVELVAVLSPQIKEVFNDICAKNSYPSITCKTTIDSETRACVINIHDKFITNIKSINPGQSFIH